MGCMGSNVREWAVIRCPARAVCGYSRLCFAPRYFPGARSPAADNRCDPLQRSLACPRGRRLSDQVGQIALMKDGQFVEGAGGGHIQAFYKGVPDRVALL